VHKIGSGRKQFDQSHVVAQAGFKASTYTCPFLLTLWNSASEHVIPQPARTSEMTSEVCRRVWVWYPKCRLRLHFGYHTHTLRQNYEITSEVQAGWRFRPQKMTAKVTTSVDACMLKPTGRLAGQPTTNQNISPRMISTMWKWKFGLHFWVCIWGPSKYLQTKKTKDPPDHTRRPPQDMPKSTRNHEHEGPTGPPAAVSRQCAQCIASLILAGVMLTQRTQFATSRRSL
jgi:hypothetical protein